MSAKKAKKYTVLLSSYGHCNNVFEVWDKNDNAPKNVEAMRRRIEKLLNEPK